MKKFEAYPHNTRGKVLDQGWVVLFDNGEYFSPNASSFFRVERNAEQELSRVKSMYFNGVRENPRVVKVKLVVEE